LVTVIEEAVDPPGDQEYPVIVLPEEADAVADNVVLLLVHVMDEPALQLTVGVVTLD